MTKLATVAGDTVPGSAGHVPDDGHQPGHRSRRPGRAPRLAARQLVDYVARFSTTADPPRPASPRRWPSTTARTRWTYTPVSRRDAVPVRASTGASGRSAGSLDRPAARPRHRTTSRSSASPQAFADEPPPPGESRHGARTRTAPAPADRSALPTSPSARRTKHRPFGLPRPRAPLFTSTGEIPCGRECILTLRPAGSWRIPASAQVTEPQAADHRGREHHGAVRPTAPEQNGRRFGAGRS